VSRRTIVVTVLVLCLAGLGSGGAGGLSSSPTEVERGRRLFFEGGCYGCHTVGAMGTPIGPDLRSVGSRMSVAELDRWLRDPSAARPRAHMPTLELRDDQVRALCAYLTTLRWREPAPSDRRAP